MRRKVHRQAELLEVVLSIEIHLVPAAATLPPLNHLQVLLDLDLGYTRRKTTRPGSHVRKDLLLEEPVSGSARTVVAEQMREEREGGSQSHRREGVFAQFHNNFGFMTDRRVMWVALVHLPCAI